MKKILLIFIPFIFIGCELQNTLPEENPNKVLPSRCFNHTLYETEYSGTNNSIEISNFLTSKIEGKMEATDEWVDPEITFNRGWGDCDDFCITFSSTAYTSFGETASILLVSSQSEYEITHAVVRYQNKIIEPQTGKEYPEGFLKIYYELDFWEVFTN